MSFGFSDLAAADAVARRFGCGLHPDLRERLGATWSRTAPDGRPARQAGPAQGASPTRIAADPGLAAFPPDRAGARPAEARRA